MRQLIFISDSSGLRVVARHASLRERTVAELQKMSEYNPPAGTRPTVFLFRVYSGGIEPLYILTRAGDAGTDSDGRAVGVVHHLIFQKGELAALLPPAEIALRFRGWCEKIDDETRFFDENEPLPPEILRRNGEKLVPARRWAETTGDAGNAALLGPFGDARATIFVGEESMTETALGLFAESAEILGTREAWTVAFATGICSQRSAGRFLWRMVGGRDLAVRHPGDFILDFLAPLSVLRAPQTAFAEYARTGIFPENPAPKIAGKAMSAEAGKNAETLKIEEARPTGAGTAGTPVRISPEERRRRVFSGAGTFAFLAISVIFAAVVLALVAFFNSAGKKISESRRSIAVSVSAPAGIADGNAASAENAPESASGTKILNRFCAVLEKQIADGDFAGAAETWLAFSEIFPQDADRLRARFLPRFRLNAAGAFAERISRRILPLDAGAPLSDETVVAVRADLAIFARVRAELELSDGQIQKKNLAVFRRAAAAVGVPAEIEE